MQFILWTTLLTGVLCQIRGFNLGASLDGNSAKTVDDYRKDFQAVKDAGFDLSFKIFSLSVNGQNVIDPILQVAKEFNGTIVAGLWIDPHDSDDEVFKQEMDRFVNAVKKYGSEHIKDALVGSEALYRGDLNAQQLASRIAMLRFRLAVEGIKDIRVGTADTYNVFADPSGMSNSSSIPVVDVAQVLYINSFPFWEKFAVQDASKRFFDTMAAVRRAHQLTPLVAGETGWPSAGQAYGAAVPSVENQQIYFNQTYCQASSNGLDAYFFELSDEAWKLNQNNLNVEPNWGILNDKLQPKSKFSCS